MLRNTSSTQRLGSSSKKMGKNISHVTATTGAGKFYRRLHFKLQTLLETIDEHVAMVGADQHGSRERPLKNCLDRFDQWRTECWLATANAPGAASAFQERHHARAPGNTAQVAGAGTRYRL